MKAAALLMLALLAGRPAAAHRLDEYLQATILSVEQDRVHAQLLMTPGVAVFPILLSEMDTDGNGVISEGERRAYAERVMHDLTLKVDGRVLTPRLVSMEFPEIEAMKDGIGEIRMNLEAHLPWGGAQRKLTLENRHQTRMAAYQVNTLVPTDRNIRILAQNRNYSQSLYELDFAQTGGWSEGWSLADWTPGEELLGLTGLLLLLGAVRFRQGARSAL